MPEAGRCWSELTRRHNFLKAAYLLSIIAAIYGHPWPDRSINSTEYELMSSNSSRAEMGTAGESHSVADMLDDSLWSQSDWRDAGDAETNGDYDESIQEGYHCLENQFWSESRCHNCTVCQPGSEPENPSLPCGYGYGQRKKCVPCSKGFYQDQTGYDRIQCSRCVTCDPLTEVRDECSTIQPRTCTSCPSGTFESNINVCTPCGSTDDHPACAGLTSLSTVSSELASQPAESVPEPVPEPVPNPVSKPAPEPVSEQIPEGMPDASGGAIIQKVLKGQRRISAGNPGYYLAAATTVVLILGIIIPCCWKKSVCAAMQPIQSFLGRRVPSLQPSVFYTKDSFKAEDTGSVTLHSPQETYQLAPPLPGKDTICPVPPPPCTALPPSPCTAPPPPPSSPPSASVEVPKLGAGAPVEPPNNLPERNVQKVSHTSHSPLSVPRILISNEGVLPGHDPVDDQACGPEALLIDDDGLLERIGEPTSPDSAITNSSFEGDDDVDEMSLPGELRSQ